ncbi:MAG: cytochrome c oxidase accessory protein CcoG, partial [Rhodoferax sp.]|uniref:cytochrome c oxidase accessory protein CcoG n=1 Tax=Rhodoferax sp. TaxID=50421 RepID=UPI003263B323
MRKVIPISVVAADSEELVSLYAAQPKIYPRSVQGLFARWRWGMVFLTQLVFYGLPWLQYGERQAVLLDLAARRFYLFGLVLYPQDFIYLTGLLVVSALSLFLFTAVAGRLWCGFTCPQTVYSEIFMWIERRIEGDRGARMRLDGGALSPTKLGKKAAKHAVWLLLSLWTGFTFVSYFTPTQELLQESLQLNFGSWEVFWGLFYSAATYGNAGFMREQVCKYMCPYARFQSAMFDKDTLIVSYDTNRGEPRGARSRKADPATLGLGSCVDCTLCVQVCPTGIDIREGLQYECIGCAACIDGCDQVMDKMGYPKGLIRYSTENALKQHLPAQGILKRIFRPRVLVYTAVLWAIIIAALVTLYQRVPLKVDVIRDRGNVMHDAEDDAV